MAEKKTALAERLKKTAHRAGFTAEKLSEPLGVSPATVWAWWSGRNEPGVDALVAYADAVGCSLSYLATGQEDQREEAFADWVMEFTDRVMRGAAPTSAYDATVKGSGELSPREQRSLDRRGGAMRRFIEEEAGQPWEGLSQEERRKVVDRMIREGL